MTKLTPTFALVFAAAACSAPTSPEPADAQVADEAANEDVATPVTTVAAPCPTHENETPPPAGPEKTPSPVERCEGAYLCRHYYTQGDVTTWFSFDGTACRFGDDVFLADGTFKDFAGKTGHWKGTYTSFTVIPASSGSYECTRFAEQ